MDDRIIIQTTNETIYETEVTEFAQVGNFILFRAIRDGNIVDNYKTLIPFDKINYIIFPDRVEIRPNWFYSAPSYFKTWQSHCYGDSPECL